MNIQHHKELESPKLRADIIESILVSCIKGEPNLDTLYKNQKVLPIKQNIIKKYFF